jgi:PAS domain S-box-containing protein
LNEPYPVPENEEQRLAAIDRLGLAEIGPEPRLDKIVRMAAELMQMPYALVTIVGKDRQVVKASHMLDLAETPRETAFCSHTILGDEILVVDDAQSDARFRDNPLVVGEPYIRFYAGAPVRANGLNVGALCVIDTAPRELTTLHVRVLADLADLASDVIALRQAGSRLIESDKALRTDLGIVRRILDQLFTFVGVLTLSGTLVEVNRAPLDSAGLSMADVVGKPFWECPWWRTSEHAREVLRDAIGRARTGETIRADLNVSLRPSLSSTIDFMLSPLRDEDGQITHLIASGADVTERDRAIREREALAGIVEQSTDFMSIARIDGSLEYVNPAGREMLGLAADEDIGGRRMDQLHPEWAARRVLDVGIPAALNAGSWRGESALACADGREIPVSQTIVVNAGSDDRSRRLATIARDTTSIHRYMDMLKRRESELRDTFENAAVGIARIGVEGQLLRANSTLCNLLGYRREEFAQMNVRDIVAPCDIADSDQQREKMLRGEIDSFEAEIRLAHKDGTLIWVGETASLSSAMEDDRPYVISIFQDIRARKQSEEQQLLLIGELNHRVKNTLATIQSLANQTFRRTKDPAEFVRSFNGRLRSLAAAHGLLTRTSWQGASLQDLVREQVAIGQDVGDTDRVRQRGSDVFLAPQAALSLGLVLHELATNAMKHGALSNAVGRVWLSWDVVPGEDRPELKLFWVEEGGPQVGPPGTAGFGRDLIERSLGPAMHGKVMLRFQPKGVTCEINLPLVETDAVRRVGANGG